MNNPSNSFNQVKNLLRKMDDSISSARTRRLNTDAPVAGTPTTAVPGGAGVAGTPIDPNRPVGNLKARPLGRPLDNGGNGSYTAFAN